MTREDAAKLWPIIKAWSEGKTIQRWTMDGWIDGGIPVAIVVDAYRIKPEPVELWATFTRPPPEYCYHTSFDRAHVERYAKEHGTPVIKLREVTE